MKQFEKITNYPPELRARFNNFIVTEFDDSMSVEMQLRVLIKWIKTNIDLTNEMVEYLNEFVETFDENLYKTVFEILDKWLEDGIIKEIIYDIIKDTLLDQPSKDLLPSYFSYIGEGIHNAFPDIQFSKKAMEYLLVYRDGDKHASGSIGSIKIARSEDGLKWQPSKTLLSDPLDLRDPSLQELKDGTLVLSFYKYALDYGQTYTCFSKDGGLTWSEPSSVVSKNLNYTTDKIVELDTGNIMIALYRSVVGGVLIETYISSDLGENWVFNNTIGGDEGWNASEPILFKTKAGRIVCLIRTADYYKPPVIKVSYSDDQGITWTPTFDLTSTDGVITGGHASGMFEKDGVLYTGVRYSSDNYFYFGGVIIYGIDIHTFKTISSYTIDTPPNNDCGYTSFTGKDSSDLVFCYYLKEQPFDTQYQIKVVKAARNIFANNKTHLAPALVMGSIRPPYQFVDNQQGLGVHRIYQENRMGRLTQWFDDNYAKVGATDFTPTGAETHLSHLQIYSGGPTQAIWFQPRNRDGGKIIWFGQNDDGSIPFELNSLGQLIGRNSVEFRNSTNMWSPKALRINDDNSSGYTDIMRYERGSISSLPFLPYPTGSMWFCTDESLKCYLYYDGTRWLKFSDNTVAVVKNTGNNGWKLP